jgi:hypothetical protein
VIDGEACVGEVCVGEVCVGEAFVGEACVGEEWGGFRRLGCGFMLGSGSII